MLDTVLPETVALSVEVADTVVFHVELVVGLAVVLVVVFVVFAVDVVVSVLVL
jgi:hypothetical protein